MEDLHNFKDSKKGDLVLHDHHGYGMIQSVEYDGSIRCLFTLCSVIFVTDDYVVKDMMRCVSAKQVWWKRIIKSIFNL